MTFYLYRNTINDSKCIAKFVDQESALERMEHLALTECSQEVRGYAVRDYLLDLCAEFEI